MNYENMTLKNGSQSLEIQSSTYFYSATCLLITLILGCITLSPRAQAQDCCNELLNMPNLWSAPQTMPLIDQGGRYCDVRAYGAVLNGQADDTAALNAAIADARTKNRVVYIPAGILKITATITIDGSSGNAVRIEGAGSGSGVSGGTPNFPDETIIRWGGAGAGPMIRFTKNDSHGHGLKDIKLDNNLVSAYGLEIDRSQYGSFENVSVVKLNGNNTGSYGVKLWSAATGITTSWNYFKNLYVDGNYTPVNSGGLGRCLWLHGTGNNDACMNTFINTQLLAGGARNALELGFTDNNTFVNTVCGIFQGTPAGTGWGVFANYNNGQATSMPNHNIFFYLTTGSWLNTINASSYDRGNTVIGMDYVGQDEPVINSGFLHRIRADGSMLGGFSNGMFSLPSGTSVAIDWRDGGVQAKALTGNTTFSMNHPSPGQTIKVYVLAAGHTVTWPATVPFVLTPTNTINVPIIWVGGSPPPASGYNEYEFTFVNSNPRYIFAKATVNGS